MVLKQLGEQLLSITVSKSCIQNVHNSKSIKNISNSNYTKWSKSKSCHDALRPTSEQYPLLDRNKK